MGDNNSEPSSQEPAGPTIGQANAEATNSSGDSPNVAGTSATLPNVEATNLATQSATVTLTETETEEIPEILSLTLRPRPTVRWDESVVDNEGLGRKSSKRCCIFHKQRAFGESSTDSSDYDSDRSASSTASGADGDNDDNNSKPRPRRKNRIARPKKSNQVPDYQRYHA